MQSSEDLLKELKANKSLFNSQFSGKARVDAFRRQSIILENITEQTPHDDKYVLYKAQSKNYTAKEYLESIDERSKNLESFIEGAQLPPLTSVPQAREFLHDKGMSLQEPSPATRRNSVRTSIVSEDLKMFRDIVGCTLGSASETAPRPSFLSSNPLSLSLNNESISENVKEYPSHRNSYNPTEPSFRTAREELMLQNQKILNPSSYNRQLFNYGAQKKSLGARRSVRSSFVPPIGQEEKRRSTTTTYATSTEPVNEHLQNIDPKMIELITNEIMHKFQPISWNDIAGLDYAKSIIKEVVVWPILRPDIFTGLRRPARGILLFGPPGTGKTLIGKCIASQSKSTFFSISASSLTSKWIGEGEKMVRALFAVAAVHQPSVIFIDEIDSLLSQRCETEHESSRRLKTEFLVQLDGANTTGDERIVIVGATNRPKELDEAARRRLVRRLYIPLPELPARVEILTNLLKSVRNTLSTSEIEKIGTLTEGYSGADMKNLCHEASMEPIRSIPPDEIPFFDEDNVRSVKMDDFEIALSRVRATVSPENINQYVEWDKTYGAGQ